MGAVKLCEAMEKEKLEQPCLGKLEVMLEEKNNILIKAHERNWSQSDVPNWSYK